MAEIIVTSTADSGAGSLRQAIADAHDGDVILFDPAIFPAGQTTAIYLSSLIQINKSVSIYGGFADGDGGYTSGATLTRYVKREIEGVETEVVVDEEHPALEGETVLLHVTTRVALDGQATQDQNHTGDFDGWTGSRIIASTPSSDVDVVLSGIAFQNAVSKTAQVGAGVHFAPSAGVAATLTLDECAFKDSVNANSNNKGGAGGALTVWQNSTTRINRCEFRSIRSINGATYQTHEAQSFFVDCCFVDCRCPVGSGGAVYSSSNSQNTFDGCTFDACTAANSGGAVYSSSNSQNTFDGCTFDACTAANSGGAVYSVSNSQNTFDGCTFYACTAANYGGAVYSYSNSQNTFDGCTFDACTANYGGAVRVNAAGLVSFVGETTTIKDCEAATGSGIYHSSIRAIVGTPSLENCEIVYDVDVETRTTRYFTTTADSGTGSLRAVLAECAANDTVEPDPETFAVGSTVTILLASPITVAKRVRLKGAGRKIVLDGQGACRCVIVNDGQALDAEDVAIVGGYTTANTGSALTLTGSPGVILTRSVVAGAYGYRPIYTSSGGAVLAISSVITGNYATNSWPGCPLRGVGSTICGNYLNGAHSNSNAYGDGSIYNATPSEVGFQIAPPDTLAAEDWDKDLWKSWDLSLRPDSSYAVSTEDWSEEAKRWAPDGEWRYDALGLPRKSGGAAGAYERYAINYYQGDEAEKFDSPSGWFLDRLHTTPATAIRSDATFYLDRATTFADAPGTSQSLVVGMNTEIIIGAEESAVSMNYAVLGLNASLTSPELEINAVTISEESLLEITSGAPTLGVLDVYGVGALDYNVDDVDGDFLFVGEVEIRNGASVANTGAGLVSIPSDAEDTTFLSPEYAIRRGAWLSAVSGTISGATLKPVPTVAHEGVGDILYEARSVDSSGAYQKLGKNDNLNAINAETAVTVRAFDGENFATATVPRTYYYVGGSVGSFIQPADWSLFKRGAALSVAPTVSQGIFIIGDIAQEESVEE